MKITKQNFIIPMATDEGEILKAYIPHPNDIEISRISRVLSYVHKEMLHSSAITIIVDYERLIDEALMDLSLDYKNNIKKALETFFNRVELSAKLSDGRDYHTMSDVEKADFKDIFRGSLLFILALWRYSYAETLKGAKQAKTPEEKQEAKRILNDLNQFFTLQSVTEWMQSFQNVSAESTAQVADTKLDITNADVVKVSQMLS